MSFTEGLSVFNFRTDNLFEVCNTYVNLAAILTESRNFTLTYKLVKSGIVSPQSPP